jgi:integrase/ribosomal protein L37AE/L43A
MADLTPNKPSPDGTFGTKAGSKSCKSEQADGSAGNSPLNPTCPKCNSKNLWRDGNRYTIYDVKVQRWLCRDCGHRFDDRNDLQKLKQAVETLDTVETQSLKTPDGIVPSAQICVTETKNLAAEQKISVLRGSDTSTANGKIVEYEFWMLKQGYAKSTIYCRVKILKRLVKLGACLFDPETIKEVLTKQDWSPGRKEYVCETYSNFLGMLGGKWDPPKYHRIEKIPFIPMEQEIDQLIAGCGEKTAALLQTLKETGMRVGEAWNLKWTDVDFVNSTLSVTPEKGSHARMFKVSNKLLAMINLLPKKSAKIFGTYDLRGYRTNYVRQRKRTAKKLQNPRINQITFHTFRHWKATMEYHRTKDILYVMRLLGHKNIKNTLIYTQLVTFENEDFICKAANNVKEATDLIEAGFEYVCEMATVKLFRKRK